MPTNSTEPLSPGKRLAFNLILWSPLLMVIAGVCYVLFWTALPQRVYLDTMRNMYYECLSLTDQGYAYKAKPGACTLNNVEYKTVLTHDAEGFRNPDTRAEVDVVLIGDSHTHGFGVNDQETFAALLRDRYHYRAKSLAMASYATMRELEALQQYTNGEKVVVIQYCDNDLGENMQTLKYPREEFLERVKGRWSHAAEEYVKQKHQGWKLPFGDFAHRLIKGQFERTDAYYQHRLARNIPMEAEAFAKVMSRYQPLLQGKKVIVFESSSYGVNHPGFKANFEESLHRHVPWLTATVLDTSSVLQRADYYWLDDHMNAKGHAHTAAMLDAAIAPLLAKEASFAAPSH